MSDIAAPTLSRIRLPSVSYGPFHLLEAVPWLMLATAARLYMSHDWGRWFAAAAFDNLCIFLAFLLSARRMIEFADGTTELATLDFRGQLRLAREVLPPILAFVLLGSFVVCGLGARWTGLYFLLGFDGIAFDQFTYVCMAWSALLAGLLLLALLQSLYFPPLDLFSVLRELKYRAAYMVPAIVAVAVADIGLSRVQNVFRGWIYLFWQTGMSPLLVKKLVYFLFIFGFASVRLWVTLAILIFLLRESYRRDHAAATSDVGQA